jgi:hypothetical protein
MNLLMTDSLRPGPSPNPEAPYAANTDESKANPYPNLPDPLILNTGQKVTENIIHLEPDSIFTELPLMQNGFQAVRIIIIIKIATD